MDVPSFLNEATDVPDGMPAGSIWADLAGHPSPDPAGLDTTEIAPVPADVPLAAEQPTVLPRPVVAVTDDTGDPDLDQVLETIWAAQVVCRTGHPPADGRTPPWRR